VRAGRRPALTWRPWSLGAGLAAGVTAGLAGPAPGVLLTLVGALVVERVVAGRRHRRELARVRRLAYTDDLTGLANRRALTQALDAALATGEPLGLVLLDLDGFKTVNDTYGHLAGDHVLRSVAVRLSQAADPGCLVARPGGDEFAVLTASGDRRSVAAQADRVRATLGAPVPAGPTGTGPAGNPVQVGASVGIAVRAADDRTATDLLARADATMYETKTTRRARTAVGERTRPPRRSPQGSPEAERTT
jgi:diguanylate cyclase